MRTQIPIHILFITVSYCYYTFLLAFQKMLLSSYSFSPVPVYIQNILFRISVIFHIPMILVVP